jgi:hypothetical protein
MPFDAPVIMMDFVMMHALPAKVYVGTPDSETY